MSYLATVEKLRRLSTEAEEELHFKNCEDGYISLLLDKPDLADQALRYLKPEHFSSTHNQYLIVHLSDYVAHNGTSPTREVLRDIIERDLTVDDPYDPILKLVDRRTNPREVDHLMKELRSWVKHQSYGRLYSEEVQEAFYRRDYDMLRSIIDDAESIDAAEDEDFGFVCAADFMRQETERTWLIEGALVARQPCLIGGRKKVLKTGILCDLAISLATGGDFLGHFVCPQPVNVGFFSCESGEDDIRDRIAAICRTRRIEGGLERLFLSFKRPRLSNDGHLVRIGKFLYRAVIDEGELGEQRWVVRLEQETTCRAREAHSQNNSLMFSLLNAMSDLAEDDPDRLLSKRQIREALRWNNDKVTTAIKQAVEEGNVEEHQEGARVLYRRLS